MTRRNGGGRARASLTNTNPNRFKQCPATSRTASSTLVDAGGRVECPTCKRMIKVRWATGRIAVISHHNGEAPTS